MSSDDKDNKKPEDKKPPLPKQVVVTHYGKKKKDPDVPPEIMPTEPTHILSSPVEIGSDPSFIAQPHGGEKQSEGPEHPVAPQTPRREAPTFASGNAKTSSPQYSPPEGSNDSDENNETVSGGGGKGALFFSVIALIGVIVLSYYTHTHYQQLIELQQKTNDEHMALSTQAQKTGEQLATLKDKNSAEQTSLENLKKLLESEYFRLSTLSGNTDWAVAQANYLVYMANERLKTAHDVTSAVTGLSAADEHLRSLANPAFLWVRDVLAKDIAKLKFFPSINRSELWEQLGLIANQFNDLQFKSLSKELPLKEKKQPPDKASTWQKGLWRSWEEFKSLIQITQIQENPIPRALSAQDQDQILRILQMILEQARWALLQGENIIYQKSLQELESLMSEYFLKDKALQDLLNQIQQLKQQNVAITLPDISDSVQALSKLMIEVSSKSTPPREAR